MNRVRGRNVQFSLPVPDDNSANNQLVEHPLYWFEFYCKRTRINEYFKLKQIFQADRCRISRVLNPFIKKHISLVKKYQ